MILYRLSKSAYALDLSGTGAEQHGGRWNSKGTPVIYTSASRAMCTAELAVHLPIGIIPVDYQIVKLEAPGLSVYEPDESLLPTRWQSFPYIGATRQFGDRFCREGAFLIMRVPSAVVQGEFNYLINPAHPASCSLKILSVEPFRFDSRLFVR
jgi:RES domain-containing protein